VACTPHPRPTDPVPILDTTDPVGAFWRAHRDGRPIALATSGTTSGAPRVIVRTTASWVDSFPACAGRLGLEASSRFWIPGPMDATMNLFAACLASSVGAGWSREPAGCTHAQLTPTGLRRLVDSQSMNGVRALVAGAGLGPDLRQRAERCGITVDHYYGAAELSLVAWGHDSSDLNLFERVEAELRDGTLWVRSPWLAQVTTDGRGYATVHDLARLDGDRLEVLGRPGAATTAGATVALAPIEAALTEHARSPVAVLAVPDARLGEVICCVADPADLDAVRRWGRRHLDGPYRPRRWLARDPMPLTAAMKIDRRRLATDISATTTR